MVTPGPTMISCPACAGVVRADVGPGHHLDFVCSVGHTFSLEELYGAKEDQLEYAQWSLLALLKHLQMILQIATEPDTHNINFPLEELHHRQNQLTHQLSQVETIIEETRLPVSPTVGNEETPPRFEGV